VIERTGPIFTFKACPWGRLAVVPASSQQSLRLVSGGICQMRVILYWNANKKVGLEQCAGTGRHRPYWRRRAWRARLFRLEAQSGAASPVGLPSLFFQYGSSASCELYVVNECGNPLNQVLTLFGYLHITFQPFFINAVALYFMPKDLASRIAPFAYTACFAGAICMLVQLYPFAWAGACETGRPLCGKLLCTVRGEWHLAWLVPTNGIGNSLTHVNWLGNGYPAYLLTAFAMPALYGSWRFILFSYLAGPSRRNSRHPTSMNGPQSGACSALGCA